MEHKYICFKKHHTMQEQFWDTIEAIRGRNLKDSGIIIYTNKLQKKMRIQQRKPH
jgi:hypothetical protein